MAYGPGLEGGVVNQPANFTVETNGETGALGECRDIVPPHCLQHQIDGLEELLVVYEEGFQLPVQSQCS